jgi:Tfp pilus assembly protein PilX
MSTHPLPGALRRRASRARRRGQRGISLMVSLVLLVVVTLIALGSMRGVVMQARMSGATHDRSLTFQAAEAALREAEARAAAATAANIPAPTATTATAPRRRSTPRRAGGRRLRRLAPGRGLGTRQCAPRRKPSSKTWARRPTGTAARTRSHPTQLPHAALPHHRAPRPTAAPRSWCRASLPRPEPTRAHRQARSWEIRMKTHPRSPRPAHRTGRHRRCAAAGHCWPPAFAAGALVSMPSRAELTIGNNPLYLVMGKANVLVVLDNSNSMDEDARAPPWAATSANSKSEVARGVVRNLTDTYRSRVNMGLMAYRQNTPTSLPPAQLAVRRQLRPDELRPGLDRRARERDQQEVPHGQPDVGRRLHLLQRGVAVLFDQQLRQRVLLLDHCRTRQRLQQRRKPEHRPLGQLPLLPDQDRHLRRAAYLGQCPFRGASGYSSHWFTSSSSPPTATSRRASSTSAAT